MKTIDAFGRIRVDGGEASRARLIQVTPFVLGAFPEGDAEPYTLTLAEPYRVKGRMLTATLTSGELLEFQRASCGCQTPQNLRGPARQFVDRLVPAEA